MNKDDFMKCSQICERAEKDYPIDCDRFGDRLSRMMDLQSAADLFNLRLDDLLKADEENFFHDVFGIWRESRRETYPCTFGLFVPRYTGRKED